MLAERDMKDDETADQKNKKLKKKTLSNTTYRYYCSIDLDILIMINETDCNNYILTNIDLILITYK